MIIKHLCLLICLITFASTDRQIGLEDIELDNLASEKKAAQEKEEDSQVTEEPPLQYVAPPEPKYVYSSKPQYIQPEAKYVYKDQPQYIYTPKQPDVYTKHNEQPEVKYVYNPKTYLQADVNYVYNTKQYEQPNVKYVYSKKQYQQPKYVYDTNQYEQPEQVYDQQNEAYNPKQLANYIIDNHIPLSTGKVTYQPQYIKLPKYTPNSLGAYQTETKPNKIQYVMLLQPHVQPQVQAQVQLQQQPHPQHQHHQFALQKYPNLMQLLAQQLYLQGLSKIPMHPLHLINFQPQPELVPRKPAPAPIYIVKPTPQVQTVSATPSPKSLLDSYIPSMVQYQYMKKGQVKLENNALPAAAPSTKQYTYQSYFPIEHGGGSTSYVNYRLGRYAE